MDTVSSDMGWARLAVRMSWISFSWATMSQRPVVISVTNCSTCVSLSVPPWSTPQAGIALPTRPQMIVLVISFFLSSSAAWSKE